MSNVLADSELLDLFIQSLLPPLQESVLFKTSPSFNQLCHIIKLCKTKLLSIAKLKYQEQASSSTRFQNKSTLKESKTNPNDTKITINAVSTTRELQSQLPRCTFRKLAISPQIIL